MEKYKKFTKGGYSSPEVVTNTVEQNELNVS